MWDQWLDHRSWGQGWGQGEIKGEIKHCGIKGKFKGEVKGEVKGEIKEGDQQYEASIHNSNSNYLLSTTHSN